jgi:hypothetical protein
MEKSLLIVLLAFFGIADAFTPISVCSSGSSQFRQWVRASLSNNMASEAASSFDNDFADAMSKPLPDWYKEQKEVERKRLIELKENRERIIREFKAKYDITEEEKIKQRAALWLEQESRAARRIELPWYKKVFGVKNVIEEDTGNVETEERKGSRLKWEKFLETEEKDTGFNFPGFFEVFPELQLKWPKWSKNKDGKVKKCVVDTDCPFPQACCPHPILPGDKFCCTGFGQRLMIPKYVNANDNDYYSKNGPRQPEPEANPKKPWQNQE